MHDIRLFEEQTEKVKENLAKRGFDTSIVDKAVSLNANRKKVTGEVEESRAEIKNISKQVGMAKKAGEDASELMAKVGQIKDAIASSEVSLKEIEVELKNTLSVIPNLLDDSVPSGKDDTENHELRSWGTPKEFSFEPKDHVELGENLGMLDFERAAKMTGARFVVYKGQLARLERALINFFLDFHTNDGYEEIIPPFIVNDSALYGTGQLPKFGEDLFKLEGEQDWFLIPTAEVPVTNMRMGELFDGKELPLRYAAYTPCFRSEAGSHGRDTRGLIRMHQFNKVEMVNIVAADKSEEAHEEMIARAEKLLQMLELPHRSMLLCTGDIGFGARKCIDLEVWVPAQGKYREISSISNCWDFQGRRAGIRYRDENGKPQFAHTLNGSGLAVGRTLVAILENYQNEDGTITIPEVLKPYMGGKDKIS